MLISEPGFAGVKRHLIHVLDDLTDGEFDVAFIYSLSRADRYYAAEIETVRARGIACYEVPMVRDISLRADVRALRAIGHAVRSWRPDIIHCHSAKAGALGRIAAALHRPRPACVYTPHAMPCYFSKKFYLFERIAGRFTDRIVAVSRSERDDVTRWGIVPPEQIRYLPLAVSTTTRSPSHETGDREPNRLLVGACGRVCSQKRSLLFFQMGETLMRQDHRVHIQWVGDFSNDREASEVKEFLATSDFPDRIHITGWVDNANEYLSRLSVFCMFSRYESFGFVTADAMALEVPVVAVDATGTRDLVIHNTTGLICDPDARAAAAAVQQVLNDERLRATMVAAAKERIAEEYSPEHANHQLRAFYRELIEQRRATIARKNGDGAVC
jgi:glycosyltransferase involved in cell wall biosynthesis